MDVAVAAPILEPMKHDADDILAVLDWCADSFTFPMLDNGYVYLAATRLSLFRSVAGCAMVIEVFGFSPRSGEPDVQVHTFSSNLHGRNPRSGYTSDEAHRHYLNANPHNESRFFHPIDSSDWKDTDSEEHVAPEAKEIVVRGRSIALPTVADFARFGIEIESEPRVQVFELCRYLADVARDDVLASADERRVSVAPDMQPILQLEEWHHPDLVTGERPSEVRSFQDLARVLVTGDTRNYRAERRPNTHWRHWPGGGRL